MNPAPLLSPAQLAERARHDLDWALLLDTMASHTTSAAGGRRLRSREMAGSFEEALVSMQRTREVLSLADAGLTLPVSEVPDLGDLLERIERSVVATGPELRDLGIMLEQGRTLRQFALGQQQQRPHLSRYLMSDPALDKLLERLKFSLENDGSLSDRASSALGRLRARAQSCRTELIAQLKRLMHAHADLLRDQYFSERDGRYVIPVRADAHRGIEGTVLDTSASGSTLFVEPREVTPQANRLRVSLLEILHEEQRLLAEMSALAQDMLPALRVADNACIEADVLGALARYAGKHDACAILPSLDGRIALYDMRHPILVDKLAQVIPNDLELSAGQGLIISGPNAGGKTISLKAFGLFAMMARAGLPMCVHPRSAVGYFSEIYCEIGDSQSIETSLSTFSSHVLTLASILDQAGAESLVLLDEVAAGTDPEQGSALASAYLEALLDRGAAVAATTHYESLKEQHDRDQRFRNAAVGFDVHTFMPTFRFLLDVAGPSTALAVAQRFGLPRAVVERAEQLIPESSQQRENLLEQLTADRATAQALRIEAERDRNEQRRLRLELEQEREDAKKAFLGQLEQEHRELLGQIRRSRQQLETLAKQVQLGLQTQTTVDKHALRLAERTVDEAAHTIALGSPVAEALRRAKLAGQALAPSPVAPHLTVGSRVFVPRLGTEATVLEISRNGSVRVRAGSLTLMLSAEDAASCHAATTQKQGPSPSRKQPKPSRSDRSPSAAPIRQAPMRLTHNTLDLRGERVDAALDRVDAFVDELLRRSEPSGYVLHGHGTGALKQAVREHLRGLACVVDSGPAPPEDGGDAFTLLWLGE